MTEISTARVDLELLKHHLERAVESHLQSEVPFGALLSGGLDSSLIASIATRILRARTDNSTFRLKTYSIGLEGDSPDLTYARMVADHIGSDHTEVRFTIPEGIDLVRDAVYYAETYDVTTFHTSPQRTVCYFCSDVIGKMIRLRVLRLADVAISALPSVEHILCWQGPEVKRADWCRVERLKACLISRC